MSGSTPVPGLVSIVIPCYRGARYLAEAMESCLRQAYPAIEVIVVDDASPDDCASIAEEVARRDGRVRVIRRPENGGVSRAFNTGFEASRGEYLTRLAQDDVFAENAASAMVAQLESRPDAGLTYCDFLRIDERGAVLARCPVPGPEVALRGRNDIGLCVMWRRSAWERVGGFDPRFDTAEDFEYWVRIAQEFPITKCPGVAPLGFRHHKAMGSSHHFERQERASLEVIRLMYRKDRSIGRRLQERKALSYVLFSSSRDYAADGRYWRALAGLARSFLLWPLPYKRAEVPSTAARLKSLAAFSRRLVFPGNRPSPAGEA